MDKTPSFAEFRMSGKPGVTLTAQQSGILVDWGEQKRRFTPDQLRQHAAHFIQAAEAAEKLGCQEWMLLPEEQ